MKISPANINFCASYVNSTKVKVWDDAKKGYVSQDVKFLKYDNTNDNDFRAISSLEYKWSQADFASRIVRGIEEMPDLLSDTGGGTDLYILSSQASDFDTLNPDKVLGLAEVSQWSRRTANLNILQAKPSNLEYKRIGSGILDCLKEKFDTIFLSAAGGTEGFYEKNGFVSLWKSEGIFVWRRPLKERFKRFFSRICD